MDQGIAGLAGAALGGFIGVVGTLASARLTGRDQRRTQHEHWRRQQRRDAYSQLVAQATEAITLGSKATDAYVDGDSSVASLSEQFGDAVRRIDTAESLVTLEGPEEAANAALELTGSLHVWANSLQLALATGSGDYVPISGETAVTPTEVEDRKESTFQVSDDFIRICRRLLDV